MRDSLQHSASPVQPDRHTDPAAWHRWAEARSAELLDERRRYGPPDSALGDVPAVGAPEAPRLDVPCADLDWWDSVTRQEWWMDLERDAVADSYGEFPPEPPDFDLDPFAREAYEAWEDEQVARQLRPRSRSMRVDAEEEARRFGWAR